MSTLKYNDNRKIVINTVSMYVRMFITMIIGFYSARLTLEILGVTDFGLNNLVGGFVALFAFLNKSMGTAVQRFISLSIGENNVVKIKQIMSNSMVIHIGIAFVTLILVEFFIVFFFDRLNIPKDRLYAANIVVQTTVVSMVLNIINVPYAALLRAKEDFSKTAILEVVQSIFRLGLLFLLMQIDYDQLIVYSLLNLFVTIFFIFSINFLARRYNEARFKLLIQKNVIIELLHFSGIYFLSVMVRLIRDKGVVLLINIYFGLMVNAAYAIAEQVKSFVETFSINFRSTVVPQIMSSYGKKDDARMYQLVFTSTKLTNYLLFYIAIPLIFEVDYFLKLWLKNPPEHSAILVILLLINVLIDSFNYFLIQVIHSTGQIKRFSIIQIIIYVFSILGMLVVVKLGFVFYSVVYVIIFSSVILLFFTILYTYKLANLNIFSYVKNVIIKNLLIFLMASVLVLIIHSFMEESIFRLVTTVLFTLVFVSFTGYYIGMDYIEKNFIKSYANSLIFKFKRK